MQYLSYFGDPRYNSNYFYKIEFFIDNIYQNVNVEKYIINAICNKKDFKLVEVYQHEDKFLSIDFEKDDNYILCFVEIFGNKHMLRLDHSIECILLNYYPYINKGNIEKLKIILSDDNSIYKIEEADANAKK